MGHYDEQREKIVDGRAGGPGAVLRVNPNYAEWVGPPNLNIPMLLAMAHSPIANYAIPGLTSSLIGAPSSAGTVRLFQNSRDHQENITPHSHRFDFQCLVLQGEVTNRIWTRGYEGDLFQISQIEYLGAVGNYKAEHKEKALFTYRDQTHRAGEQYSMKAHEIHSIKFSKGATVLFFEGPTRTGSVFIEPVVDGVVIPTMKVEPWMFQREKAAK